MQSIFSKIECRLGSALLLVIFVSVLCACGGGGGGGSDQFTPTSQTPLSSASNSSVSSTPASSSSTLSSISSVSSSLSSVSSQSKVTLSGSVTYDFVPHNTNHVGLNYFAVEQRPVRGAVIELLDDAALILATATTSDDGGYSFSVAKNSFVKVRVKAQILKTSTPGWNFKVTDNTSGNALYVLDGSLSSVGSQDSKRNLNATSGWDGASYSAIRAAAPFAILDNIYIAVNRLSAAGNKKDLLPLELRWSTKNSAADGDAIRGEIGTSYYDGSAIYILGDADHDTDEYDAHVLLHEWGHYIESELYRSDSIGGSHADGDSLDMRVAMSEGFANAFSGMMINDVNYADAYGASQSSGFFFSIGRKSRVNKGFFNEGSVGSILFNYYASSTNKNANDYSSVHAILSNSAYINADSLTSIYLFSQKLKQLFSSQSALFDSLLQEQDIFGADEYGVNESNSGGSVYTLPVYRDLTTNNVAVNVCSSVQFGKNNKLGNAQLLKLNITEPGVYNVRLNKSGGADVPSKPEFILHSKGVPQYYVANSQQDFVSGNMNLSQGNYVLEVFDANNRDSKNTESNTTCFNVRATPAI